jgi:pilus assembly protein Flp/PilA
MIKIFLAAAGAFVAREDAPTMTEYAMMVALISIVALAAVTTMGSEISTVFETLKNSLAAIV